MKRSDHQAAAYAFPYHWLPHEEHGAWTEVRLLTWGLRYQALLETVRDLVLGFRPARVLDLGCGDGRLDFELLAAGVDEVMGVELLEQAVAFARTFNMPFGERARFHLGRLSEVDEGAFDAAVAMEVLEHIPDAELPEVVDGLRMRLRAEGQLIVSVPTVNLERSPKHERHYTEELLREHLEPAFRIDSVRYVHRLGATERVIRRLSNNRLAVVVHPRIRRGLVRTYRRRVLTADATNGAHLVAVAIRD